MSKNNMCKLIGFWVRTMWDDVGARDGVVVEADDDGKSGRVYFPFGDSTELVRVSQVTAVGSRLLAVHTGL